jgi:hypothetical protein
LIKNIFLITLIAFSIFKSNGQKHFIGLKNGISMTNIKQNNFLNESDLKIGFHTGIFYEYLNKKGILFASDLIYNQRGFKSQIIFTDKSGYPTKLRIPSKFNYNYISIPLKVGYNYGNKYFGFVNIGLIPSVLVYSDIVSPTFNQDGNFTGEDKQILTDQISKFDLASLIEIGGGFSINKRTLLQISCNFQKSITTTDYSTYFPKSNIKHFGTLISISIKYNFIQKKMIF